MLAVTNGSLVLLSSTQETALKADEICSSIGGRFSSLNDFNVETIKPILLQAYTKSKINI